MFRATILSAAAIALLSSPAIARPKVVSSTPAAGGTIAAPSNLTIRFSEPLVAARSGASIAMTGMNGMVHAPMAVAGAVAKVGPDKTALAVTLPKPLTPGTYRIDWYAAGTDAQVVKGSISFTVR